MKKYYLWIVLLCSLSTTIALADASAVSELLQAYAMQGAVTPDAQAGQRLWRKTFAGEAGAAGRSCTACLTA